MKKEKTYKTALEIRAMSDDEFIAYFLAEKAEHRHIIMLHDLGASFKRAKKYEKSCGGTTDFELAFNKLKTYKAIHGWDRAFIKSTFGVDFNEAKAFYYRLRK